MIGPGRNRPCPCGSGKKFKQCHGKPGRATTSPEDRAWQELRRALDGFQAMMLRFTKQVYGVGAVHEAWAEFLLWPEDDPAFDAETAHMPLFMPWFFHRWAPDPRETSILDADLHDRSPTSVLLERRGRRLDPRLRRYLEVCGDAPFSFHEIVRCDPGVGFRTRDIFVGAEHDVAERAASRILQVGDAFFGQIVASDGVALLEACGPYVISPRDKIGLIELRERMSAGVAPPTTETLGEWDFELRDAYLDLAVLHRTPPEVRNTDGEDVEFHRLDFEIESAQRAFDALKHLALDETDDELLEAAEMDEGGRVRRVSFPWKVADDRVHAGWDSTVLGHLEIDGTRLVVSVNSAERAERIMRIMEERLGQGARLAGTDIQSIEDAVRESGPAPSAAADVVEHPEVRERIRQLMSSHYESWVSEKIPALDDLSPLEAVQAPAGREKVKALVDQIERDGSRMEPPLDPGIVRDLRQRLGLS